MSHNTTSPYTLVDPAAATGTARELLDAVKAKLGIVPNIFRAFANSPAALNGYLQLSGALGAGVLDAKTGEQIALAVAERNDCDYCLAAHSAIGRKAGLDQAAIDAARRGTAADPRTDAIVRFSRALVEARGHVSAEDIRAARDAGLTDAELVETVAHVALNTFTNYLNVSGGVPVDFPAAKPLTTAI